MTDIDLLKICNYIIENHTTFEETSVHFGCSLSTIRNYIKKLKIKSMEDKNSNINWREILNKINEIKEQNQIAGKSKGSKIGKRISKWNDEDIELIARTILLNGLTLRKANEKLGELLGEKFSDLSKSTIYDLLGRIKDPELATEIRLKIWETRHNPEISGKIRKTDNDYGEFDRFEYKGM